MLLRRAAHVSALLPALLGAEAMACSSMGAGAASDAAVPPPTDGSAASDGVAAADSTSSADAGAPDSAEAGPALIIDVADEEPLGPFASWVNVQTQFGAKGDGVTDDAPALQAALSSLCVVGATPPVDGGTCNFALYFPKGTYLVKSTLTMELNYGASLVGEDPTTTSIVWGGTPGGTLLRTSGSRDTLFTRLTWNGNGTAGIGVAQWWNYTVDRQNYQGGIKHIDEVFEDLGIGIFGGREGADYGQGDSEVTIRRVQFLRESQAGLNLGSFNALDYWVWDSVFTGCARGVTNDFSFTGDVGSADAGPTAGAGNFMIYRSLFQGSTVADMEIGNTSVWFSLHDNVSIHSQQFIHAMGIGDNGCAIIAEGNRVIETTDPTSVEVGNTGPLLLVDNQIRSADSDAGAPVVLLDDMTGPVGRNVFSLGNAFTRTPAIGFAPAMLANDRAVSIDDTTVAPASISEALPPVQPVATNLHRNVIEVPVGASASVIQSALDAAAAGDAGDNPVVHLPGGTYYLDQTVTIPALARLQLVGDGMGATVLNWSSTSDPSGVMLRLAGPSYASVRDLTFIASEATGLDLPQANQPGGRIFVDGTELVAPITVTGLSDTRLELQTSQFEGLLASASQSVLSMGGTIGTTPVDIENGTRALLSDHWYEGDTSQLFRGSSGTFTYMGGMNAPYSHGIRPDAGLSPSSPSVLVSGFAGSVSFIAPAFDLVTGQASAENGIRVANQPVGSTALFLGTGANRDDFYSVTGDAGAVGIVLSKGPGDASTGTVDLPDFGDTDASFIAGGFRQARSLVWETTPFVATPGATDVRIDRVIVNTAIRSQTAVGVTIEP
jgi:hypothetical protein